MEKTGKMRITVMTWVMIFCCSCSDWLDVEPKSQVKDKEMFSSEAGFKEVLAGVYTLLTDDALYAKELRFGMMGVLAQEWDYYSSANYQEDALYNYGAAYPEGRIDAIWSKMYNAIANVNTLLESIDEKKSVFTGINYDIIKGEALALRAFMHFDLLRCFGASWEVGSDRPAIPYVVAYTSLQSKQLTVAGVIGKIQEDLKAAAGYLLADPIYTGTTITEMNDNGYLMNRQLHLNYYAVKALQARVYLYIKEYTEAARCAQEVIDAKVVHWSTQSNMMKGADYTGAPEQLWGLDVVNLSTIADNNFTSLAGSNVFSLKEATLMSYYENNTDDYRYLYLWVNGDDANADSRYLTKYYKPDHDSLYYHNKMSMIKLAEMYYIQAECQYQAGKSVLPALNAVREARGVTTLQTEPVNFYETLTTEFRKEFVGEGQLFFFYKRRNAEKIYGTDLNLVDEKAYVFPLPQSEYEAADRENNR